MTLGPGCLVAILFIILILIETTASDQSSAAFATFDQPSSYASESEYFLASERFFAFEQSSISPKHGRLLRRRQRGNRKKFPPTTPAPKPACMALGGNNPDSLRQALLDVKMKNGTELKLCAGTNITWDDCDEAIYIVAEDEESLDLPLKLRLYCGDNDDDVCIFDGGEYSSFFSFQGEDVEWEIERITLQNGNTIDLHGGALTITNSILIGNTAHDDDIPGTSGGVLNQHGGTLTITDSIIHGNKAGNGRCGVICSTEGTLSIVNAALYSNEAMNGPGGAIFNIDGNVTITDSFFRDNSADGEGGAIGFEDSNVTIERSFFFNNSASSWGGGISILGGYVHINNSYLINNDAGEGGAIIVNGNAKIENSFFLDNSARANLGGGLAILSGDVHINNSYLNNNDAAVLGGGIGASFGAQLTLKNCTLSENIVYEGNGSAIAIDSGVQLNLLTSDVISNRYSSSAIYVNDSVIQLDESCVTDNNGGIELTENSKVTLRNANKFERNALGDIFDG